MRGPLRSAVGRLPPGARRIAIFVVVYSAAYLYSASATLGDTIPAPLWAPDAVLLCALLLSDRREWWAYLLLAIPIRLSLEAPGTGSLAVALADYPNDAIEAIVSAAFLRRLKPDGRWFSSSRDFATFGSVAIVTVPALSALGGAARLAAIGPRFWPVWAEWTLGDALANLLLAPLILSLAYSATPISIRSWRRTAETGLLIGGLVLSGTMAFRRTDISIPTQAVLLCIPFPFLLWSAIRFGVRGTSAALSLFALSGIWAIFRSHDHSTPGELQPAILSFQLFLLVVGSSLLFLAVILEERRAIEHNLRSTQARLARAEAVSMVMVVHVGLDGRCLRVPRKMADLLGYPRGELLGRSCNDLTYPADLGPEIAGVQRLLAGEIASFQLEKRFVRHDGALVWLYLSRSIVRDPDGRPLHFLDYLTDIGELKRAEAATRRSEKELRLFAEHSPAAVALLDVELRFVLASRRFRKDFQRDDLPIAGRRYEEALVGFPARWPEAFRRALEGASDSAEDDLFAKHDGTTESLRWEIVPDVSLEGQPAGPFLFAELTTDRKRGELALEDLRRQLAHLMRVSILGELSGALAHELSQPLAAILANAQAAQTYLARGPSGIKEVASILEDIVSDDLRAGHMIGNVRKLLRKGEPEFRVIDLNDLIREVLDLAQSELITKNVAVGLWLVPDLPPLRGDRVQIQQVLLNLIVNACEAMAAGPSAERRLRIETAVDRDDTIHVAIHDTGPGVPSRIRDRLFEPFLTTKSAGLGLGLAICRSIVQEHGGRIWQEGNETGGASFHVALPRIGAAE